MPTSLKNQSSGFTIVELLVTIIVGGILIGSATVLLNNYTYLGRRALDLTVANSYAENKIESLRSQGFLGLTNGQTDVTSELPSTLKSPKSATVNITTQSTSVKKVDLTVSYSDQGAHRTYYYTTYIGELGVGQY